jgi:hypothetical protein
VSADFMTKIGLMTHAHTHPYYIRWLNNSGKAKVTHTTRIHFSIGTYHDYADGDVVPMQACSLLLGRPWEFDIVDAESIIAVTRTHLRIPKIEPRASVPGTGGLTVDEQ